MTHKMIDKSSIPKGVIADRNRRKASALTTESETLVNRFPLEEIEWVDTGGRHGWDEPEDTCEAMMMVSIGWITDESNTAITVTGHMQLNPRLHHADLTIPKCAIANRIRLRG